jgi:hypothetical protein
MSLYTAPSGDFTPYVKYNAKAGRWYCKKDGQEVEVQTPTFVADFANVKKAWMYFAEGQAPDVVYFPSIDQQLASPSEKHKLGLSLNLYSEASFGGVVKLESNSANTCSAISDLYGQYTAAAESKAGKLPVVKVTGAEPVKGNFGTNFKPVFAIEKWVDRPAAFDASATPVSSAPSAPVQSAVSEF